MKKKMIIAIIVAIVAIGGGIGGYMYHFSQVKAEKMANYKKALSDYRFNSNRLIYSLDFIATDFIINWNSAIMNKKAMNAKNEIVPCSDFEDAVSSRYAFYDKYGAYKILDSIYVSLGKHLEKIDESQITKELLEDVIVMTGGMESYFGLTLKSNRYDADRKITKV